MAGDARGAWGVVEAALAAGAELEEIYLDVLAPAMAAIGARHMDEAPAQRLMRFTKLGTIDLRVDYLRQGIHLRGYAQKNPKQEYKRESFTLFQELLNSIKHDTIRVLSFVQVRREDPAEEEARMRRDAEEMAKRMQFQHAEATSALEPEAAENPGEAVAVAAVPVRAEPKVGRNEPCPCGSGKKYKHCHGQLS